MNDWYIKPEELRKTLVELRKETPEETPEDWMVRAMTAILMLSMAHQNGTPYPWPLMQYMINALAASMPKELFVLAGKTLDQVEQDVDEINEMYEHFEMPAAGGQDVD